MSLEHLVREPAGEPAGALVLLHGRGADMHDLYPLLDALDPDRRLLGITPQGPLRLPPGGFHWYRLGGIPTPDPSTFWPTFEAVKEWLGELELPFVLGGFSQGAVMTYALTLSRAVRPAAAVCLSGFIPRVDGLDPSAEDAPPFAIGHGTYDDVISVEWSREARELLADPLYREYPLPHAVDPRYVPELAEFVRRALP